MLRLAALFAILTALAFGSPLPMPAVKLASDVHARSDVRLAARAQDGPWRLTHWYPNDTPCWVDGRRGWVKDQTCGDLIAIDAKVSIGKRGLLDLGKSRHGEYLVDGLPCFRNGKEGLLKDTVCLVADLLTDDHGSQYYPWRFTRFYADQTPCWVDNRRGSIRDGYCGDLLDIDADIKIGKRGDLALLDGVPCWKHGQEGLLKDSLCVVLDLEIKRGFRDSYYDGHKWGSIPIMTDGTPCFKNGKSGIIQSALCVASDLHIGKSSELQGRAHHGPIDGDKCLRNGRWGVFKDALCILVDIDVKRDLLAGLVDTLTGHFHNDHGRHYKAQTPANDNVIDIDADVTIGEESGRRVHPRDILGGVGHDKSVEGAVKGVKSLLGNIGLKNRDLLGMGHGPHHHSVQGDDHEFLDLDSEVTIGSEKHVHHRGLLQSLGLGNGLSKGGKPLGGVAGIKRDILDLDPLSGGYHHHPTHGDVLADVVAVIDLQGGDHKNHLLNHVIREDSAE